MTGGGEEAAILPTQGCDEQRFACGCAGAMEVFRFCSPGQRLDFCALFETALRKSRAKRSRSAWFCVCKSWLCCLLLSSFTRARRRYRAGVRQKAACAGHLCTHTNMPRCRASGSATWGGLFLLWFFRSHARRQVQKIVLPTERASPIW